MSGSKTNDRGGGGFLGTDDLDLDAWDATFDALHVPGEPGEGGDLAGPPAGEGMIEALPDEAAQAAAADDITGDLSADVIGEASNDFGEAEEYTAINDDGVVDDAPEYVAKALSQPYRRTPVGGHDAQDAAAGGGPARRPTTATEAEDVDDEPAVSVEAAEPSAEEGVDPTGALEISAEQRIDADDLDDAGPDDGTSASIELEGADASDFSDDSTVELGDAVMLAEFDKFEEAAKRARAKQRTFAAVVPRDSTRTDAKRAPAPPPDADADVYTSAARPGTSNEVAAPPRTSRNILARTVTPTIAVSRTVTPSVPSGGRRRAAPDTSSFDGQESTRIADFGELEQGMSASRQSSPALSRPTPPSMPVAELDDDYADIEIEGSSSQSGEASAPDASRSSGSGASPLPWRRPASEGEIGRAHV
jgi:hypothetical protein